MKGNQNRAGEGRPRENLQQNLQHVGVNL